MSGFPETEELYEASAMDIARATGGRWATMHEAFRAYGRSASPRSQAFFLEERVVAAAESLEAGTVFDCGCGFGASLEYLANILPETRFSGICASSTELETARARLLAAGLQLRCHVYRGDCEDARNYRVFPPQDVAYAIGMWRHVRKPAEFLATLRSLVRPGGRLCIGEWLPVRPLDSGNREVQALAAAWLRTWRADLPAQRDALVEMAKRSGFGLVDESRLGGSLSVPLISRLAATAASPVARFLRPHEHQTRQTQSVLRRAARSGLVDYCWLEFIREP